MTDIVILERANSELATDAASRLCPNDDCERDAARLTQEIVARFVQSPVAFAEAANPASPSAFVQTYLKGVDQRLSALIGAPRPTRVRIATLGMETLRAPTDPLEHPDAAKVARDDVVTMPHMGPVMVACAVVGAACAVVQAVGAVVQMMRKPIPL